MMRKAVTLLVAGVMALSMSGCEEATANSDAEKASGYQAALESIEYVESVEVSYSTHTGMGRTGSVAILTDSTDPEIIKGIVEDAIPALVNASNGDPNISIPIWVQPTGDQSMDDGKLSMGPEGAGFTGTPTLNGYRNFVECGVQSGECP